jgi:hypothetical protein
MLLSLRKFMPETKGEAEMKTIANIIMGLTFINSILLASGGPPPPPPLFSARNVSAVYQPPLNLAGENQSALFAQVYSTVISETDGKIELEGTSTNPDGTQNGKNFKWETPGTSIKLGLYPAISRYTSLILTLGMDNAGRSISLTGFNLGFNTILSRNENHLMRFGCGFNIQKKDFLWIQSASGDAERDNNFDYDPFLYLTYSSSFSEWLFNPFVQVSYSKQTLLDNKDYSQDIYYNLNIFTFTPGLSYNWGSDKLISLGFTFSKIIGIKNSKNVVLTPLLQFSYLFGRRE